MKKLMFTLFAAALLISGCNKSENATTGGGPGRLSVKITDDPFDINSVESAMVTVTKIEVRKSGGETENPFLVVSETPVTVNLINLRNGISEELANIEIESGDYDLVRLYVGESSLKMKDIAEPFNLKVPSGEQTGIKVFISPVLHVEGGLTTELLLDFDLAKSYVMRGHDMKNGFIFKPVIRAANNSVAGRIEGYVKDSGENGIENVKVAAIHGTDTIPTFTDGEGYYMIPALLAGSYSMLTTKENYDTVNAADVVVIPANKVIRNFVLVPSIPEYVSSVVENATPAVLEMTYSLTLADIVPAAAAFTVKVNSVPNVVTSVAIAEKKVLLTLTTAVVKDAEVKVAYTVPATNPLQTAEGAKAVSLEEQDVTNKVGI